jgi:hypothetical protein
MKAKTIYIVSGYMRSGTSMMMKCLEAGGMKVRYHPRKDLALNKKYARKGYQPNPGGFYELEPRAFNDPDFTKVCSGRLIKVLHWRLTDLAPFDYKIIFMLRDPKEIEVSYLKMLQRRAPFVLYKYHEWVHDILAALKARGMDALPIRYQDVIGDPLATFSKIKANNWPVLDIEKAAAVVNPELYRSRSQDLNQVRQTIPGLRTDLPECLKDQPEISNGLRNEYAL